VIIFLGRIIWISLITDVYCVLCEVQFKHIYMRIINIWNKYSLSKIQIIKYNSWQVSTATCFDSGVPCTRSLLKQRHPSPTRQLKYQSLSLTTCCKFLRVSAPEYLGWHVRLVFLCCNRHPEHGTPLPKHVGVYTYHKLYFMFCIVLYFIEFICLLIYWLSENAKYE
jgi:hypothetical protein